jgi:hypothetical protein
MYPIMLLSSTHALGAVKYSISKWVGSTMLITIYVIKLHHVNGVDKYLIHLILKDTI